jgi:hypothetical protein
LQLYDLQEGAGVCCVKYIGAKENAKALIYVLIKQMENYVEMLDNNDKIINSYETMNDTLIEENEKLNKTILILSEDKNKLLKTLNSL